MSVQAHGSVVWHGRTHFGWGALVYGDGGTLSANEEHLEIVSARGTFKLHTGAILRIERAGLFPTFVAGDYNSSTSFGTSPSNWICATEGKGHRGAG